MCNRYTKKKFQKEAMGTCFTDVLVLCVRVKGRRWSAPEGHYARLCAFSCTCKAIFLIFFLFLYEELFLTNVCLYGQTLNSFESILHTGRRSFETICLTETGPCFDFCTTATATKLSNERIKQKQKYHVNFFVQKTETLIQALKIFLL